MDYEKDYDLPFGNFFLAAIASLRQQVVSFHRSFFETNRIAKTFATYSRSVFLSIEVALNSGN